MEYVSRTFRSAPNLSQEEALEALQSHPLFRQGAILSAIRPASNRQWVATVKIPAKVAGPPFPPKGEEEDSEDAGPAFPDDGSDDGPKDEAPESPDEDEGEPPVADPSEEGPPKEEKKPKGKGGTEEAILQTLQQILHALQGGAGPEGGMGGPDALAPGPSGMSAPPKGPPPPPAGGKGGPPPGAAKLRPGEVPNHPGVVPVGSPAFASTKEAQMPGAPTPGAAPGAAPATPIGATCAVCGGPQPCPQHSSTQQPLGAQVAACVGRLPTFVAATSDELTVAEAVSQVREAVEPHGYKVKQAKREANKIRVLASVH